MCGTYTPWNITQPWKRMKNAMCSNTDGPRGDHTDWSRSDREAEMPRTSLICGIKKKWYEWTSSQNRKRLTALENGLLAACTHCYILNVQPTRTHCRAQGALLLVMWQPGWEGSLRENGYMYTHGWVPLLSTWNCHNPVNRLYSNIKQKVFFN